MIVNSPSIKDKVAIDKEIEQYTDNKNLSVYHENNSIDSKCEQLINENTIDFYQI